MKHYFLGTTLRRAASVFHISRGRLHGASSFFWYVFLLKRLGLAVDEKILHHDIPYVNQFGTVLGVEDILQKRVQPSALFSDWKASGASDADEFDRLAWQVCGMTCLDMILAHRTGAPVGSIHLFKRSLVYGCYRAVPEQDDYLGMFHAPFLKFVRKEFGFRGRSLRGVGPYTVARLLARGAFVIASVHHSIRDEEPAPPQRNGHLVLLTGFAAGRFGPSGFFLHNPSGTRAENQKYHFVSTAHFRRCFSGNIIAIF